MDLNGLGSACQVRIMYATTHGCRRAGAREGTRARLRTPHGIHCVIYIYIYIYIYIERERDR